MNDMVVLQSPRSRRNLSGFILAAFLFLRLAATSFAGEPYLLPGHPDGVALLAPPPVAGSAEALADLASARAVFNGRTAAEEFRAKADESLSFSVFERAIGPDFDPTRLPKTEALLKQVKQEIGEVISIPKNYWKRLRPYQVDPQLVFGEPEKSFSYPSAHSSRGTVYALVLAELYPDKRQAILAVGRELGWDRVLMGKHFPTDVIAGRVLGQAIARDLLASAAFQRDLAAAKAEVEAARQTEPSDQAGQPQTRKADIASPK
jgi:acid phosphatase (class A)